MEYGLFWLFAEEPRNVPDVAKTLAIGEDRCRYWLQLINELGLFGSRFREVMWHPPARES